MPTRDAFELVLASLQRIEDKVDKQGRELAHLEARDEEHKANIHRFWAENWAPLEANLANICNRLDRLERVEFSALAERLTEVEKASLVAKAIADEHSKRGALTGAGAGATVAGIVEAIRHFWHWPT